VRHGLRSPLASEEGAKGSAATLATGGQHLLPVGSASEGLAASLCGALGLCCGLGCRSARGRVSCRSLGLGRTVDDGGWAFPPQHQGPGVLAAAAAFGPAAFVPPNGLERSTFNKVLEAIQIGLELPWSQFPPGWLVHSRRKHPAANS